MLSWHRPASRATVHGLWHETAASANDISRAETGGGRVAPTKGAGLGASCWQRRPQIAFAVCWSTQAGRVRAAILPGSYKAREAAPDMIKSPSATLKAMKKSGLRDAVGATRTRW